MSVCIEERILVNMEMNKKRSRAALMALAITAFAIGTTEFISVG